MRHARHALGDLGLGGEGHVLDGLAGFEVTEEVRGEAGLVLGGLGGTAAGGQGRAEPAAREAGGGGEAVPSRRGGEAVSPGRGGERPGGGAREFPQRGGRRLQRHGRSRARVCGGGISAVSDALRTKRALERLRPRAARQQVQKTSCLNLHVGIARAPGHIDSRGTLDANRRTPKRDARGPPRPRDSLPSPSAAPAHRALFEKASRVHRWAPRSREASTRSRSPSAALGRSPRRSLSRAPASPPRVPVTPPPKPARRTTRATSHRPQHPETPSTR